MGDQTTVVVAAAAFKTDAPSGRPQRGDGIHNLAGHVQSARFLAAVHGHFGLCSKVLVASSLTGVPERCEVLAQLATLTVLVGRITDSSDRVVNLWESRGPSRGVLVGLSLRDKQV
jgi:hypothetical protein